MTCTRFLLLPTLLAACGAEVPERGNATANQIERLSTPKAVKADPLASARLQPLAAIDLEAEGLLGVGCEFRGGGQLLLVAVGSDALVKIAGELRHLIHSAPVGETGGFFEDRQLGISVGRTEGEGTTLEEASSWPARLTVTNRRTEAEFETRGIWSCGA